MKLTAHFDREEFDSGDGATMPPAVLDNVKKLAKSLQALRDYLGKAIAVNSGYRSASHNRAVGGAPQSQHVQGKAADIAVAGMPPEAVAEAIEKLIAWGKMPQGGVGIYGTFTHYDIRGVKARWDFRK